MQRVRWLAAMFSLLLLTPVRADDRSATSGLAVGAGFGSDNAGLGVHASYYLQLPETRHRFAFHVAGGCAPVRGAECGPAGGVFYAFGRRHRGVFDVYVTHVSTETLTLHGVDVARKLFFGVGASVGGEWMAPFGLYVRASIGPVLVLVPPGYRTSDGFYAYWNLLSVGYKLW